MPSSPDIRSVPLRVLHVASGDLWAGAEAQAFELLRALNRDPMIEVYAAVMNPGAFADRLASAEVAVKVFDETRQSTVQIARGLSKLACDWQPRIIHTHRRKEHILGAWAAYGCGAHSVATVHGRSEFTHPWWRLRQSLLGILNKLVLRHQYRAVVAVSEELLDHLTGSGSRVVVIPNGIDVESVRRAASAGAPIIPGARPRKLAFLGRLVPVKRVDKLIETAARLDAAHPEVWSLYIIGDGPLRSTLESQAKAYGLDGVVHFLGFQERPLPLLAKMDALLFASEHEGLPMTALEALAIGVPVVAPSIGGLSSLLAESRLGHLLDSLDAASIASSIAAFLARPALVQNDRSSALPAAYHIDVAAARYVSVYRGCMT